MSERTGIQRPFYWTQTDRASAGIAPSGWWQWTRRGLVYLGERLPEDGLGVGERFGELPGAGSRERGGL